MKLGIMQPYLFPYIGYWQLLNDVDQFVIYDNIQYSKRGWFNRNYILINGKKKLFTVPLKNGSDFLDVKSRYLADNSNIAIKKIINQLEYSYRKAPFFEVVFPLIKDIFMNQEKNLFRYLYYSITQLVNYLKIDTRIVISSDVPIDHSLKSQEKVLALNKELGAKTYINPIGGIELYQNDAFGKENIELLFLKSNLPQYTQFEHEFIPSLSMIDVLMFNSIEEISNMLKEFTIIRGV